MSDELTQDELEELKKEIKGEDKPSSEKFRELILGMYEEFPNFMVPERKINKVIKSELVLESLEKQEYLVKESIGHEGESIDYYSLGSNALNLVNSWRNEKLTRKVVNLTYSIILLTILMIGVSIVNVTISPKANLISQIVLISILIGAIIILLGTWINHRS